MRRAVVFRCKLALTVALVTLVVAQAAVVPVGAQSIAGPTTDVGNTEAGTDGSTDRTRWLAQQSTPSNNSTTVRHRDPDAVNEDGDLESVESHLSRQLSQRLGDSAVEIEQGEYERARSLLGDEYDESLEQYVDIAGETGNEAGANAVQEATQQQRSFSNEIQEYQETRAEYEQAKREGDEQRARELARTLERQSANVTQRGSTLIQTYNTVENRTGTDLTEAKTSTANVTRTVERQQADIREVEFTETRLQLTANRRNISFADPLFLDGRLVTEDGEPVTNRTITLQVGEDRTRVDTNASGQFSVTYRPRTVPLSATTLSVEYVPVDTAPYLGNESRVPITIDKQIAAEIQLAQTPETVAYNDSVVIAGAVETAAQPVTDVPVRVVVGETQLGTVRTDSEGRFRVETRFPAAVATGEQSITGTYPLADRAVTANATQSSVVVESTATTLSTTAEHRDTGEAMVTGQLQTADGDGIASQSIAIQTDGSTQTIVETNATGWYRASIPITGDSGSTAIVEATFEKPATNLEPASASTRLQLPSGEGNSTGAIAPWAIALVVGLLGVVGTAWYVWRRRRTTTAAGTTSADSPIAGLEVTDSPSQSMSLLEAAESTVSEDPNVAVRLAYGALRSALVEELSTADNQTHWEFYHACRDAGLIDGDGTLRAVTEWYEQAAYSRDTVEQSTAEQALETVRELSPRNSELRDEQNAG